MAEILFSQKIGQAGTLSKAMRGLQDQVLNTIEAGANHPGLNEDSFSFGHQRTPNLISKILLKRANAGFDPRELDSVRPNDRVCLTDNGVVFLLRSDENSSQPLFNIHDLFDPKKQEQFKRKSEPSIDLETPPAPTITQPRGRFNETPLDNNKKNFPPIEVIPGDGLKLKDQSPKIAEEPSKTKVK